MSAGAALAVLAVHRFCQRRQSARLLQVRGRYQFHDAYREVIRLRNGTRAWLRPVHPNDKALLVAGMEHLSPDSRYQRFHRAKTAFTNTELRYLTEVDGVNHFALGAGQVDGKGQTRTGLGVARFVRLPDDPSMAEAAVVVADEMQGLGRALFLRLIAAARERGVATVRCYVLGSNIAMRRLVAAVAPEATTATESETLVFDIPLTSTTNSPPQFY